MNDEVGGPVSETCSIGRSKAVPPPHYNVASSTHLPRTAPQADPGTRDDVSSSRHPAILITCIENNEMKRGLYISKTWDCVPQQGGICVRVFTLNDPILPSSV